MASPHIVRGNPYSMQASIPDVLHLGIFHRRRLPTEAEAVELGNRSVSTIDFIILLIETSISFAIQIALMASASVPRVLSNTIRQIGRSRPRIYSEAFKRAVSTKHPKNFSPPSNEELTELRERVQDFTRACSVSAPSMFGTLTYFFTLGREIPEEVAAKTDRANAFPNEMWRKFGEAGYAAAENPRKTLA